MKKVFDWAKAARIIKEQNITDAYAGLAEDWGWTSGIIFQDGKVVPQNKTYTYLASTWATPQLLINHKHINCYIISSDTKWNAQTYWPKEALEILQDTTGRGN